MGQTGLTGLEIPETIIGSFKNLLTAYSPVHSIALTAAGIENDLRNIKKDGSSINISMRDGLLTLNAYFNSVSWVDGMDVEEWLLLNLKQLKEQHKKLDGSIIDSITESRKKFLESGGIELYGGLVNAAKIEYYLLSVGCFNPRDIIVTDGVYSAKSTLLMPNGDNLISFDDEINIKIPQDYALNPFKMFKENQK